MNISNAIRNVERVFMNFPDIASEEDIESFEISVEAMKKQMPMKPRFKRMPMSMCLSIEEARFYKVCGNCKEALDGGSYCPDCGQAIDWTED